MTGLHRQLLEELFGRLLLGSLFTPSYSDTAILTIHGQLHVERFLMCRAFLTYNAIRRQAPKGT
jgi:hypothetical protein